MKEHTHLWNKYFGNAVGCWEKRDCPGNLVYFSGRAEICREGKCNTLRFICDDPRLQIVEVREMPEGD